MMITREFLKNQNFRVFTREDYFGFQGVESPVPLIAETDTEVVIIDGTRCEAYSLGYDGAFDLVDLCEDITALA